MVNTKELAAQTERLLRWNERILQAFQERGQGKEADFYEEIQPFILEIEADLNKWKALSKQWVAEQRPKYIHTAQIEQTYDNLQNNALQCFVGQRKEKRFKETYKAVAFVLQRILQLIR
ncbi:MAG: YppE family protein [Ectobacillus sp.]